MVGAPSAVCDSPAPRGWQSVDPHVDHLWEKTPPERSSASRGRTRSTARRVGGAEPRVSNALWDFDVSWYLGVEGAVRTRSSSSTSDHVQSPIYARVLVVRMSAQGGGRSGGKLGSGGNDQVKQGGTSSDSASDSSKSCIPRCWRPLALANADPCVPGVPLAVEVVDALDGT